MDKNSFDLITFGEDYAASLPAAPCPHRRWRYF